VGQVGVASLYVHGIGEMSHDDRASQGGDSGVGDVIDVQPASLRVGYIGIASLDVDRIRRMPGWDCNRTDRRRAGWVGNVVYVEVAVVDRVGHEGVPSLHIDAAQV